jgi:methyltransferase family protein
MSDARLTDALARLDEHHQLHLPLRRSDLLGRLALRFLWRRQLKWQMETNIATRDAVDAIRAVSQAHRAKLDQISDAEDIRGELESLRRSDENMLAGLNQRLYSAVGRVQSQVSDLRMQLSDRLENNSDVDLRIKALEGQIAALAATAQDVRLRHMQFDLFLDELRAARPQTPGTEVTEKVGNRDHFIELAIPELLDGPAEQVREARRPYLADVTGPVLDMAPGRGEWLEVLRAAGIPAQSASLNPLIRRHCANLGCEVAEADPLDFLAGTTQRSLGAVTAFRYVERLDPAVLARFVDLAAAALQPGGVLIIETPSVDAKEFHVDPFARRPVHPTYLRFLADAAGFARVESRDVDALPVNRGLSPLGQAETAGRYCLIAWR